MAPSNLGVIAAVLDQGSVPDACGTRKETIPALCIEPEPMARLPVEPGCHPVSVQQGRALVG